MLVTTCRRLAASSHHGRRRESTIPHVQKGKHLLWYSPGVKANVLFFDKSRASKTPATKELWVYDLRTNKNFTLRHNPITDRDLEEFVSVYEASDRIGKRTESERFKRFRYADLADRDKTNLDLFWLKRESDRESSNLPKPAVVAAEIIDDLRQALREFSAAEEELDS